MPTFLWHPLTPKCTWLSQNKSKKTLRKYWENFFRSYALFYMQGVGIFTEITVHVQYTCTCTCTCTQVQNIVAHLPLVADIPAMLLIHWQKVWRLNEENYSCIRRHNISLFEKSKQLFWCAHKIFSCLWKERMVLFAIWKRKSVLYLKKIHIIIPFARRWTSWPSN